MWGGGVNTHVDTLFSRCLDAKRLLKHRVLYSEDCRATVRAHAIKTEEPRSKTVPMEQMSTRGFSGRFTGDQALLAYRAQVLGVMVVLNGPSVVRIIEVSDRVCICGMIRPTKTCEISIVFIVFIEGGGGRGDFADSRTRRDEVTRQLFEKLTR